MKKTTFIASLGLRLLIATSIALVVTGCSKGSPDDIAQYLPEDQANQNPSGIDDKKFSLSIVDGDGQEAPSGRVFPKSLKVRLADAGSTPRGGEIILFYPDGESDLKLSSSSVITSSAGEADVAVQAGASKGKKRVVAKWSRSDKTVEFNLVVGDARADDFGPTEDGWVLSKVDGDAQTASSETIFADPIRVRIRGKDGTPRPGEVINFYSLDEGADVTIPQATAITDASGAADAAIRAGKKLGTFKLKAAWPKGGQAVEFTATVVAGHPEPGADGGSAAGDGSGTGGGSGTGSSGAGDGDVYALTEVRGNYQTTNPDVPFSSALAVRLSRGGAPVDGKSVKFAITGFGEGDFTPPVAITDDQGVASTIFTPSGVPRLYSVEASFVSPGVVASPFVFSLETRPRSVDDLDVSPFEGCSLATPIDTARVEISYAVPENAGYARIYRNGILIAEISRSLVTGSFLDSGLVEGQTYTYGCRAVIDGFEVAGTKLVTVTTRQETAPVFAGVDSVESVGPNSIRVRWKSAAATGVPAEQYRVYFAGGFSKPNVSSFTPVAKSLTETIISGLGDDIPYSFLVRACSKANLCDENEVFHSASTTDGGAPNSRGATSGTIVDGAVALSAPWSPEDGQVSKRMVYVSTGSPASAELGDYTKAITVSVTNPISPPTTLVVSNLAEGFVYNFIVVDEDTHGAQSLGRHVVSVSAADLTPPTFLGIASIARLDPKDSSVEVGFVAVAPEISDPTGASYYHIYASSSSYPVAPVDPCGILGVEIKAEDAALHSAGAGVKISLLGLSPRTNYRFCVKASDSAGNKSDNKVSLAINTVDLTPPPFNGLTSLKMNADSGSLALSWQESSAEDLRIYKIRLWKNSPTPPAGSVVTIEKSKASLVGASVSRSDFAIEDGDIVYATVAACDDAGFLPGGSDNCSPSPDSSALSINIPDTTPPPFFGGVASSLQLTSPVEGVAVVRWILPTISVMGGHYAGFLIYSVEDGQLVFLKNANCQAEGFPTVCHDDVSAMSETLVSNLNPGRTYQIHVRAYDRVGNVTELAIENFTSNLRISDSTPPTLIGSITIGQAPGFYVSWDSAVDNQWADAPGNVVTYRVYRKQGTTFANPSSPSTDGLVRYAGSMTSFIDSDLTQGQTYYYALCAQDASSNSFCPGRVTARLVSDIVVPVVSQLRVEKNYVNKKKWDLKWSQNDNVGVASVKVYRSSSFGSAGEVTTHDEQIALNDASLVQLLEISGPADVNVWVNYLVVAQDLAGNRGEARVSIFSANVMTITSVDRPSGAPEGGKLIFVKVTNPSVDAKVLIDGVQCAKSGFLSETEITCVTPPSTRGEATVPLAVVDGASTANYLAGYVYSRATLCDSSSLPSAGFTAGNGTNSDNAYLICSGAQLKLIASNCLGWKFFIIGDNIDLSSFNSNPASPDFAPLCRAGFQGTIDGGGFTLFGYSFYEQSATVKYSGLLGRGFSAIVKNARLAGFKVGSNYLTVGTLAGEWNGGSVSNVEVVKGEVEGLQQVGGLVGNSSVQTTFSDITIDVAHRAGGGSFSYKLNIAGGLLGQASSPIIERVTAKVVVETRPGGPTAITDALDFGGLVGLLQTLAPNGGHVSDSSVSISFPPTLVMGTNMGGIAGRMSGAASSSISYSKVTGNIYGKSAVGGVVGSYQGGGVTIDAVEASIDLAVNTEGAGGFVGMSSGAQPRVENSIFSGKILCTPRVFGQAAFCPISAGGVVGTTSSGALISHVLVTGEIRGQAPQGAIFGAVTGGSAVATGAIWRLFPSDDPAYQPSAVGTGVATVSSSKGLSLDDLLLIDEYVEAGFDLENETVNGTRDLWFLPDDGYTPLSLVWLRSVGL